MNSKQQQKLEVLECLLSLVDNGMFEAIVQYPGTMREAIDHLDRHLLLELGILTQIDEDVADDELQRRIGEKLHELEALQSLEKLVPEDGEPTEPVDKVIVENSTISEVRKELVTEIERLRLETKDS